MEWLVDTLGGVVGPALVGLGALISWVVRSRYEEYRQLERSLVSQQRKTYADILDPFIQILANTKSGGSQDAVIKQVQSKDYRKTTFDLSLFGTDDVVRAYNDMMQYLYTTTDEPDAGKLMELWGELLLEIRRSVGHRRTKLSPWDMLAGMLTELDKVRGRRR